MVRLSFLAAAAGLLFAQPAHAECWDETTLNAARLYEFHIRVESAGDRCHYASLSIAREYKSYFANHSERLNKAAATLNKAFSRENGFAKRASDKYTVAVLNKYGAGQTTRSFCTTMRRMLNQLADENSTEDELHTFALLMVREPTIEKFCPNP
ncbi:MAG: hypothetical protein AAFR64_02745 [Pseudomonadota bacterium]